MAEPDAQDDRVKRALERIILASENGTRCIVTMLDAHTHYKSSEWIVLVRDGKIVEMGNHDDLVGHEIATDALGVVQHGFYSSLWKIQQEGQQKQQTSPNKQQRSRK